MTVVMLTPLFPPDTSESAAYAKLLATHLSDTSLTVLAYGKLPEAVEGVTVTSIDKSGLRITTVLRCLLALHKRKPTLLISHNGPSSDLPALVYKITHPTMKLLYIESDKQAATRTTGFFQRLINNKLSQLSAKIISLPPDSSVYLPIEKLPFAEQHLEQEHAQTIWWQEHIELFNTYVR